MKTTIIYRRSLPHIQPKNGTFFVTFRLKMHIPEHIKKKIQKAYLGKKDNRSAPGWSAYAEHFREFDNFLDFTRTGPHYLSDTEISEMIKESFHYRDGKEYELVCYTIMSNHVHMVIAKTSRYLFKIMHSLKRYTGYLANKILGREGPFWQSEYYDHLIRNEDDFYYHVKYTIENPVKAKLVTSWEDWTYTYLSEKYKKVGPIANRTI